MIPKAPVFSLYLQKFYSALPIFVHMKSKFFLFTAFVSLLCACSEDSPSEPKYVFDASVVCPAEGTNAYGEPNRGTFTDERDGQVYKYTTIGNQVWMAENLNFDNGSPCAKESCSEKGREYTPMDAQNACPNGWHLPTEIEWNLLFDNVGGIDTAAARLKATEGWTPLNPGQASNGTDDCGFSLYPIPATGTYSNHIKSIIEKVNDGYIALVWTGNPLDSTLGSPSTYGVLFETQKNSALIYRYYHEDYQSIRCVKD